MSYEIAYKATAVKELEGLQKQEQTRIVAAIEKLKDNPYPPNTKKLQGSNNYRIRVGNYRVVYQIKKDVLIILIIKIGDRKEVYKQ